MLDELSLDELRAIDRVLLAWVFDHKDLILSEASSEQIDVLVAHHKVKRALAKRCVATEF